MPDRFQNPVDLPALSSDPSSPSSGYGRFYSKTDGKPYFRNAAGEVMDLSGGGEGALTNTEIFAPETTEDEFVLEYTPLFLVLFINNAYQSPDAYTVVGDTITLDTAIGDGDVLQVQYLYSIGEVGVEGFLLVDNELSEFSTTEQKAAVRGNIGLGNVDNTSDANKPVSTATQTELNGKQAALVSGTNIKTVNGNSLLGSGNVEIASGGSDIVHAEAVDTNVAINNASTPQTVLSKALTGIAAGDIVEVEIFGNILNNSGSARTYVHTFTLGGTTFNFTDGATIGASATTRSSHEIKFRFAVIATNNISMSAWVSRGVPQAAGTRQAIATTSVSHVFENSTNNETGNKTVVYACHGQSGTATQTFEMRTFKVSLIKKKP
jgi:hypothetical protein